MGMIRADESLLVMMWFELPRALSSVNPEAAALDDTARCGALDTIRSASLETN